MPPEASARSLRSWIRKTTERAAGLALGAFSCPGCRNSCRKWTAIEDRSAQHWTAYALVDAKNARRLASDSGISDNTRVPEQNLSLLPHDAGRIGGPRRSPADYDTIMQL
jgi:hypothetical protein